MTTAIAKFDEVANSGVGLREWLEAHIHKQGPNNWLDYYDDTYPPEQGTNYLTHRDVQSIAKTSEAVPCSLRLPQLALHPMSGNSGLIENPSMRTLFVEVLSHGFLTDVDSCQGVEKLASRLRTDKEHIDAEVAVHPFPGRNPLASAWSIFHTKGWKRTIAANLVVAILQDVGLASEAHDHIRASLTTVHCVLRPVQDIRESVECARQITTASTTTRRPVNCFNHLHQLRLCAFTGATAADESVHEWNKKQIQDVFKIGPAEAAAAKNLAFHTTPHMVQKLAKLVEDFGMHNRWGPMQHVALASELLCTGGKIPGLTLHWTQALQNTDSTINLLADRIDNDWRMTPKSLRKTLTVEAGPHVGKI